MATNKITREALTELRHEADRYERFKREEGQGRRHRRGPAHVPPSRELGHRDFGTHNATVAMCRAFVPRQRKRGGTGQTAPMDPKRREQAYRAQMPGGKLTPRQYRQIGRADR